MESVLSQAMVKVTQDSTWYSRTYVIHKVFHSSPTEKEYMIREIMGLCCASFEVSLVIPSLFSLKNGIRGLYVILMVVQYLIYRNGVDSYVAVIGMGIGSFCRERFKAMIWGLTALCTHQNVQDSCVC